MDITEITNENLFQIDWSRQDRVRFLNSTPKARPIKLKPLAPGLPATGLIGRDVSAIDRRSVKAQLAGRGDMRAAWWNLNEKLHRLLVPNAASEDIMYAFHKRHQIVTLTWLTTLMDYEQVFRVILSDGCIKGLPKVIDLLRKRGTEKH